MIHVLDLIDENEWVRDDQGPLRTAAAGDIRMSTVVLTWSLAVAQIFLGLAMGCAAFRILRGPRAQDRVLGLEPSMSTPCCCF